MTPVFRRLGTSAGALKAVWCGYFALRSAQMLTYRPLATTCDKPNEQGTCIMLRQNTIIHIDSVPEQMPRQ